MNLKPIHQFLFFLVVAIMQLVVPAQMIINKEAVINKGAVYKFKTRPVDPNDPFRGKYITLRFDINKAKTTDSLWRKHEEIYVYLKEDSLGFAEVAKVSKTQLFSNKDYVLTKVNWYNKNKEIVYFTLPFNRFYMEEYKAKPAEDVYRIAQRDSLPNNVYGLVYIKNGDAVLDDVIVNETSISEYVAGQLDKESLD